MRSSVHAILAVILTLYLITVSILHARIASSQIQRQVPVVSKTAADAHPGNFSDVRIVSGEDSDEHSDNNDRTHRYIRFYKSFYSRNPPAKFDKWIEYAEENQCQIPSTSAEEERWYGRIERDLSQFRVAGVPKPIVMNKVREKVKRMWLLHNLRIRNGRIDRDTGRTRLSQIIRRFAKHLPDMELYINFLAEPRVLKSDKPETTFTSFINKRGQNAGKLVYEHCRSHPKLDAERANETHGFLVNPVSFDITTGRFPIFSYSIFEDCFSDILIPSHYNVLETFEDYETNIPWEHKKDVVYWRGSTTGGESTSWNDYEKAHRLRLVKRFGNDVVGKDTFDVAFIAAIHCDEIICSKIRRDYTFTARDPPNTAYAHKYVLDVDGNGFSRRHLHFLRSNSLIFKQTLFQSWVMEFVKPWEHYIPISTSYDDLEEKLQWAKNNEEEALKIVQQSSEFAKKHLRDEDQACYMFRLMLEYAEMLEA